MARERTGGLAWKQRGVLYVPAFQGNRERWVELAKTIGPVPAATSGDVLAGLLRPLSGKEFSELQAGAVLERIDLAGVQMKDGQPDVKVDSGRLAGVGHTVLFSVVRAGLTTLYGYVKKTVHPGDVNPDGTVKPEFRWVTEAVDTGAKLVDFVANEIDPEGFDEELELVREFKEALLERSVLEAGLVKEFCSSPAGIEAGTLPSPGDARVAEVQATSSPTRKDRKKKSSGSRATAKGATRARR